MGLIISIAQTTKNKAEVWEGDISLSNIRSLVGVTRDYYTVHCSMQLRGAALVLRLQEAHCRVPPYPTPEEGIPELVIPNPEFPYLAATRK